ncbi:hypothetical protein SLEP1_g15001 [Rubroshorea leprosula]|uniref:Exostosin GT47 domain-containing protein n=1 Tax=Rubroshorea leprosula TaxID=152421 RepID=A0AAV5IRW6_9ROSI|nr:hypothetical protein SLEP1_g15001 [Rubroshorea leprosula]
MEVSASCSYALLLFSIFLIFIYSFPSKQNHLFLAFEPPPASTHNTSHLSTEPLPSSSTRNTSHLSAESLPSASSSVPAGNNTIIPIKKRCRLERIEADLAQARAAIHEAIQKRSFKSDKDEIFIPRGSMYRNAYAFQQSHIEMVKRFKIWAYRDGERPLVHSGPLKHIYAIEGQFIDEIENGNSSFIAQHPDEAHAFFAPVSVQHIVEYVYRPITSYDRDRLVRTFKDYIMVVAHKYPYWNASNGADHFMLSCHDWAPGVSVDDPELYKNFVRVLCNANMSEGFQPERDATLPEFNISPLSLTRHWFSKPPQNRSILAFFSGGRHGDIREGLINHWVGKDNEIQVNEYLPKGKDYARLMGDSKYCLCPSGFEVASPRLVESFHSGCVPVIISSNYSLPFNDVLDWTKFSVNIPVEKIPEIKKILQGIPEYEYLKMQKRVTKLRRHFQLNRPPKPFDALHMVLHSIWLRRLNIRLQH